MMKRAYEKSSKDDGFRILVDRLWPRGVSKKEAHIDLWLKEIAPSTALRESFGHEVEHWRDFVKAYNHELRANKEWVDVLKQLQAYFKIITLVYAAADEKHNNAYVLKSFLEK